MKSKTTADLPSLRDLMAAGAHFGHRKEWSTPASRKFTFVIRDGVCVINLEETQSRLADARHLLEQMAADGKKILIVATKRQAQVTMKELGAKAGMPVVSTRWLGGTLTNFEVIRKNIQRMVELEGILNSEKEASKYTKKERLHMTDQVRKLHASLDGIAEMTKLPDLLLVLDPVEEETAVREARRMGIPVMAICDTDTNPDDLDHAIPANTNAPKTIELLFSYLAEGIAAGKSKAKAD